jgi:hypothetical protein
MVKMFSNYNDRFYSLNMIELAVFLMQMIIMQRWWWLEKQHQQEETPLVLQVIKFFSQNFEQGLRCEETITSTHSQAHIHKSVTEDKVMMVQDLRAEEDQTIWEKANLRQQVNLTWSLFLSWKA